MPISKTDFVRGLQCKKMLWLDSHCPDLRIIPPEVQARLDKGNEFGDKAMGIFGDFVETTTFKADGRLNYAAMLTKTQALLASGEQVICEAAFSWYGNYCAVDILRKEGNGYALYEVKNSPIPAKQFIVDLGFQRLILRKCGVPLTASKLILSDEISEENAPLANPAKNEKQGGQGCVERIEKDGIRFKIVDVDKAAKLMERTVEKHIFEFGKLKRKDAACPMIGVGEHCEIPYPCWYIQHCKAQTQINTSKTE